MAGTTFVHEDGTYVRTGDCCRCGQCCVGNPFTGEEGMCPLFKWLSENVGHCQDREHSYYLSGCNSFPSHPSQISDKPLCSYTFEKVK